MKIITYCLYLLSVFTFLFSSCSDGADKKTKKTELSAMLDSCNNALQRWEYDRLDSILPIYYSKALSEGSSHHMAYAYYLMGSYRQGVNSKEVSRRETYLEKAQELASQEGNKILLSSIYNSKGLWEMAYHRHYHKAQYWLTKAMQAGREGGNKMMEISAEANLSELCRVLGDTLGYEYDTKLFEYAQQTSNTSLLLVSGFHCALYHVNTARRIEDLAKYTNAMKQSKGYQKLVPLVYATFYYQHGNFDKALQYINMKGWEQDASAVSLYAKILTAAGKPEEANRWIKQALSAYTPADYDRFAIEMMHTLASNLASRGKPQDAYHWLTRCMNAQDSITNERQMDQTEKFKIEYDVYKKDNELLMQRRHTVVITWSAVIIIILLTLIIIVLAVYYVKRKRLYRAIVGSHLDAMHIQLNTKDSEPQQMLNNQKAEELYAKIKEQMDCHEVWRNTTITREKFAELIGCNRTYFSATLKQQTGMSYAQFMNKRRIDEAIRILSDSNDDTPMKQISTDLGFVTPNSFYVAFKKATGLTPTAYRATASELKREKDENKSR